MQANPVQCLRLDLEISVPYSVVLDGLDAWFEWGLISEVDFKWRNGRSSANRLTIVAFQNDQILQGLDLLLELGLITQKSIILKILKQLCNLRIFLVPDYRDRVLLKYPQKPKPHKSRAKSRKQCDRYLQNSAPCGCYF